MPQGHREDVSLQPAVCDDSRHFHFWLRRGALTCKADHAAVPLYMPGSNERALEKAKTIPADALILDLEDAVAPDAKPLARDRVCAAVESGGYGGREIVIRIECARDAMGNGRPARSL